MPSIKRKYCEYEIIFRYFCFQVNSCRKANVKHSSTFSRFNGKYFRYKMKYAFKPWIIWSSIGCIQNGTVNYVKFNCKKLNVFFNLIIVFILILFCRTNLGYTWLTQDEFHINILETVREKEYENFIITIERLMAMPYSTKYKEFVNRFRKRHIGQKTTSEIPQPQLDVSGRAYVTTFGMSTELIY